MRFDNVWVCFGKIDYVLILTLWDVEGIVPSGVLFPFMQWGGRTLFFLSIVRNIDEVFVACLFYARSNCNLSPLSPN